MNRYPVFLDTCEEHAEDVGLTADMAFDLILERTVICMSGNSATTLFGSCSIVAKHCRDVAPHVVALEIVAD